MGNSEIPIDLELEEADADTERLDELTIQLMRELQDLGVDSVERQSEGPPPEGTKGDPVAFTWGALALAVVPTLLPKLVEFLQSWVMRGESRKVVIKTPEGMEIEFTPEKKLSKDEYLALVEKLTQPGGQEIIENPEAESAEILRPRSDRR